MTITISPTTLAAVFGMFIGMAFAPLWWLLAAGAVDAVRALGPWVVVEMLRTWRRVAGVVAARNEFWWRWWRGEK